eukprot:Pgem_evm1s6965
MNGNENMRVIGIRERYEREKLVKILEQAKYCVNEKLIIEECAEKANKQISTEEIQNKREIKFTYSDPFFRFQEITIQNLKQNLQNMQEMAISQQKLDILNKKLEETRNENRELSNDIN